MTEAILAIKRWGNSLAVRLPAVVAREARLEADLQVRITVENGRVVITPLLRENPSLEQRLARFDPQHHGGEAMTSPRSEPNNGKHARQSGVAPALRDIMTLRRSR